MNIRSGKYILQRNFVWHKESDEKNVRGITRKEKKKVKKI